MVDRVEGRAQVEQDERNELATVDCADDIVVQMRTAVSVEW